MVREVAKDAILLKLKLDFPNTIISAYEFCFAAGYALGRMNVKEEVIMELRETDDYIALKEKVQDLVREADVFAGDEKLEKLQKLIVGCRLKTGKLDEDTQALFEMGLQYVS